jgi:hypothetical protein
LNVRFRAMDFAGIIVRAVRLAVPPRLGARDSWQENYN